MLTLVDSATGTTVTEDVVLDVHRAGSGSAVLVLHGVEGVEADQPMLDLLAERHGVVAPSHPGFDCSPRPDWCDSIDDLAYIYLEWLDQLDHRDITLVGLQFGGWVAAEMAVRSCERLSRLVLVDSVGIKVGGREDRDIADVFAMSRTEVDRRVFHDVSQAPSDLATLPEEQVLHIARNEEALALYGWEPYLHNPRLYRWLRRISVPSLVVWGESDGVVSPDYGHAYAKAIPGAGFEVVEQAGHRPQVERPERLATLIAEFVG